MKQLNEGVETTLADLCRQVRLETPLAEVQHSANVIIGYANRDHPLALYFRGLWLRNPFAGLIGDDARGTDYLRRSAHCGCVLARATLVHRGIDQPADSAAAITMLESTGELCAMPRVQGLLGSATYKLVPANSAPPCYARAGHFFQRAADGGDVIALHNLGYLYYTGLGVEGQDRHRAVQFFSRGARLLSSQAMHALASCYLNGIVAKCRIVGPSVLMPATSRGRHRTER
jgi:TPR repeat protein